MPKVLNKHTDVIPPDAIYVGRGSQWGNPFIIGKDGNRDTVVKLFEEVVLPVLKASGLVNQLRGHNLICHCAPKGCHADSLLKEANK